MCLSALTFHTAQAGTHGHLCHLSISLRCDRPWCSRHLTLYTVTVWQAFASLLHTQHQLCSLGKKAMRKMVSWRQGAPVLTQEILLHKKLVFNMKCAIIMQLQVIRFLSALFWILRFKAKPPRRGEKNYNPLRKSSTQNWANINKGCPPLPAPLTLFLGYCSNPLIACLPASPAPTHLFFLVCQWQF